MKLSTEVAIAPTDAITAKHWLDEGHVYVDTVSGHVTLRAGVDDLERLAAACITAANLVRAREAGAA